MKKTLLALMILASLNAYAEPIDDSAVTTKWGYSGQTGPEHWYMLDADFKLCRDGKHQSPIDIPSKTVSTDNKLKFLYSPAPIIIMDNGVTQLTVGDKQLLVNDGHGVQLNYPQIPGEEHIKFDGKTYTLLQFHFHTPSENKLDGVAHPMEIHFVHKGENGELAVIGVFVKKGKKNPTVQKVVDNLPKEEGKPYEIKGKQINPLDLIPKNKSYHTFPGSLTTPPCLEGITWIVMHEPIYASAEQIAAINKASEGDNARPAQPVNDRKIQTSKK